MSARIAKTKRSRTVTQRKNGHDLSAKTKVHTPTGIGPGLARMLRPQSPFHWLMPSIGSITPTYIESTLRGAMGGDHLREWELFRLMFDSWPELSSCKQELTYGLMRKNLIFEPYHEEDEKPTDSAIEKSKMVSAALRQMNPENDRNENALEGTIRDILTGWFCGVSVLEVLWNTVELGSMGLVGAPRTTYFVDPKEYGFTPDGRVGLRPLDSRSVGSANTYMSSATYFTPRQQNLIPFPPHKFLTGIHQAQSGGPLGGSLLRPLAWWWCAANFSSDWLMNLAQVFGLPFRWANYADNAPQETIDAICAMLQNMGSSGWAAFPVGTTMELKAPPGGNSSDHSPQGELLDRADRYCRSLILGQTMTGGAGTTGKGGGQAFGKVEENVKADRVDAAGRYVASVLNDQLIKSILALNYGDDTEAPSARFLEEQEGELATAQRDQVLVSMGMPIGVDYLRKKYDIPEPGADEEVVSGMSTGQKEADAAKTELLKQGMDQKAEQMKQGAKPGEKKPDDEPAKASEADPDAIENEIKTAFNKWSSTPNLSKGYYDKPKGDNIAASIRYKKLVQVIEKHGLEENEVVPRLSNNESIKDLIQKATAPAKPYASGTGEAGSTLGDGHWVTHEGRHIFIKSSELHAKNDDLDFYLGDMREKFFQAFKGDLAPLRNALQIALAGQSEVQQREALITLKPKLPQLLETFISQGVSPQILAKAIATAFTDGWQTQKTP